MSIMSPKQCKAARSLLGWTQEKLATAAGLAPSTIVAFEDEKKTKSPRSEFIDMICVALEKAGILLTDGHGVKLRTDNSVTYKGPNSSNEFFYEMAKDIKLNKGDLRVFIKTLDILTRYSGESNRQNNFERLQKLTEIVEIQCLIATPPRTPEFFIPSLEMKSIPKMAVAPTSFFIHGNKLSFIRMDDCLDMTIFTICESTIVQDYKNSFDMYWDHAPTIERPSQSSAKQQIEISAFI